MPLGRPQDVALERVSGIIGELNYQHPKNKILQEIEKTWERDHVMEVAAPIE